NTLLTPDDYAYIAAHCRARALVVSESLLPQLQPTLDSGQHDIEHVIVSEPTQTAAGRLGFESLLADAPIVAAARTLADEIAFWLYSSGSTGKPKGVVHTHGNLWHTAELYAKPVLGIREEDVAFSAAKLFFAYGLGNGLTFPLSVGATTILMAERPTPQAVFKRLTMHRPSVFYGVPTLYASMMASPDLPARDTVAMRICASAGEALPRDIGERFTRHFGCQILDGIGSTEMLHIFLSNQLRQQAFGHHQRACPAVGRDVGVVIRREQGVDGDRDHTRVQRAQKGDRPVHRVVHHHQYVLFAAQAESAQRAAKAGHALGKFAVA
ncbi:AMP-binding enzyme, partial [Bordetella holmesii CDC-H785-BH]